ncbi:MULTISPECIES: isoamylase early set domain-containing protein [unclassified Streptomyces]|uniref:isoamylase early set domain-containing protein n=1 Tax=unclassified Streptomyces TaxID=2593676 RepID=UPI002B1D9785|nr:isoamylase early set domain-containing protein [Streptomyces sp. NBC_00047]
MHGPFPDSSRLGFSLRERKQLKGRTQVTFILPEDNPDGPVSVVGDFNHWNPAAAHPLEARGDGTRAACVSLPSHSAHSFRYLAASDYWFDDEHADGHDGTNGRLHTWVLAHIPRTILTRATSASRDIQSAQLTWCAPRC